MRLQHTEIGAVAKLSQWKKGDSSFFAKKWCFLCERCVLLCLKNTQKSAYVWIVWSQGEAKVMLMIKTVKAACKANLGKLQC